MPVINFTDHKFCYPYLPDTGRWLEHVSLLASYAYGGEHHNVTTNDLVISACG